jgi:hypothetical protein
LYKKLIQIIIIIIIIITSSIRYETKKDAKAQESPCACLEDTEGLGGKDTSPIDFTTWERDPGTHC